MKKFIEVDYDLKQLENELSAFEDLLSSNSVLSESSQILPFFKKSPYLSALVGKVYFPDIVEANRIAYEFDIFSDFKADLVVGDFQNGSYAFIEFEDATQNSIFKNKKGKYQKEWSAKFEHGYSQIIDWFWKLDDMKQTFSYENIFGLKDIDFEGILIIGRNSSFNTEIDKKRFRWRRRHTIIQSKKIHCVTYDELLEDLKQLMIYFKN
jgi:hypothetical protein